MSTIDNPFAKQTGLPSVSFAEKDSQTGGFKHLPVGTTFTGTVLRLPEKVHATKFGTSSKLYWHPQVKGEKVTEAIDSVTGKPNKECWSIVVAMKIDGEDKALWVPEYSSMFAAVGDAINNAKVPAIEIGGTLSVSLVGYKQGEDPAKASAKQYEASYSPPNVFTTEAGPAEPTALAGPPAKPVVAAGPPPKAGPPAKPAGPVLVDGYSKAQWIEAGYDDADFAADPKFQPFRSSVTQPVQAAPAPKAVEVDIEAQRKAAAINMAVGDWKLLGDTPATVAEKVGVSVEKLAELKGMSIVEMLAAYNAA